MDKNYLCEIKTNSIYIDAAFMHLKKKSGIDLYSDIDKEIVRTYEMSVFFVWDFRVCKKLILDKGIPSLKGPALITNPPTTFALIQKREYINKKIQRFCETVNLYIKTGLCVPLSVSGALPA